MAYTSDDYRAVVRGTFDNGEVWYNTWGWHDEGSADGPTVDADFHGFYAAVFGIGSGISSHAHAVGMTVTNLGEDFSREAVWDDIDGDDLVDLLPTSCAVRLSVSNDGVRGGPYIAGWGITSVDADGNLLSSVQTGLVDALETLVSDLDGHGASLNIIRPTTETLVPVTRARVGKRFDVIRKRSGELVESYAVASL